MIGWIFSKHIMFRPLRGGTVELLYRRRLSQQNVHQTPPTKKIEILDIVIYNTVDFLRSRHPVRASLQCPLKGNVLSIGRLFHRFAILLSVRTCFQILRYIVTEQRVILPLSTNKASTGEYSVYCVTDLAPSQTTLSADA